MKLFFSRWTLSLASLVTLTSCGSHQGQEAQLSTTFCCPVERMHGINDNFALPTDPNYLSPEFSAYLPTIGVTPVKQAKFDTDVMDKHFVHSIKFGISQASIDGMCSLDLRVRAKAIAAGASRADNDQLIITVNDGGIYIPVMTTPLGIHSTGIPYDKHVDLKPYSSVIGGKRYINIRIQDDTSVDYISIVRGSWSSSPCPAPGTVITPL